MRKLIIIITMLLMIVGCTNKDEKTSSHTEPENSQTTTLESLSIEKYDVTGIAYHNDKLIVLYSANNNTEIAPSKIAIANAKDYNILHELELDISYVNAKIITLDNGFYINQGNNITVYDYELKALKEIDLFKLQQRESSRYSEAVFAISPDIKKAAYVNSKTQSLVVYDFETEKEKEIYHLSDKKGYITKFIQLYFTNDYIGFSGQYIYADTFRITGSNVYGRINIETKKVDMYEKNETTTKSYGHYMLVVDLLRFDDNDLGTKEAIIYDIENNKRTVVNLDKSYNSFDLDIISPDLVVSYNDVNRDKAKLILYQNGESKVMENAIPAEVFAIGSCYDSQKNMIIIFYDFSKNNDRVNEIKGVELK